jgi:hypothetical protein
MSMVNAGQQDLGDDFCSLHQPAHWRPISDLSRNTEATNSGHAPVSQDLSVGPHTHRAATTLQRIFRGMCARKLFAQLQQKHRQALYAHPESEPPPDQDGQRPQKRKRTSAAGTAKLVKTASRALTGLDFSLPGIYDGEADRILNQIAYHNHLWTTSGGDGVRYHAFAAARAGPYQHTTGLAISSSRCRSAEFVVLYKEGETGKVQPLVGVVSEHKRKFSNILKPLHTIKHKNCTDAKSHLLAPTDALYIEAQRLQRQLKRTLEGDSEATDSDTPSSSPASESDSGGQSGDELTSPRKKARSNYSIFQSSIMKEIKTPPGHETSGKKFAYLNSKVAQV